MQEQGMFGGLKDPIKIKYNTCGKNKEKYRRMDKNQQNVSIQMGNLFYSLQLEIDM